MRTHYCLSPIAVALLPSAAAVQPLLANDTLQELVVAFYDNLGQLVSKVSFIIKVCSKHSARGSVSTSCSSNPRNCSINIHCLPMRR